MNFIYGPNFFVGVYISVDKMGHDITRSANPVMTMYPRSYNIEWIEVDVYL